MFLCDLLFHSSILKKILITIVNFYLEIIHGLFTFDADINYHDSQIKNLEICDKRVNNAYFSFFPILDNIHVHRTKKVTIML